MSFSTKKSKIVSKNSANGGRFTRENCPQTLIVQKITAITAPYADRYIKRGVCNESELLEENVAVHLDMPQDSALTRVNLFTGTQRDTQADIAPGRYYGIGELSAGVSIGGTTLTIQFPSGSEAFNVVLPGDLLVIRSPVVDGARANDEIEQVLVDTVTSWVDDLVTLEIVDPLTKNWAINATVASAITAASVGAVLDTVVETNVSFNESLVELLNSSTVEQTVTLSFSGSTSAFTASSDDPDITLPAGNIASEYAPINPLTNLPYFTIPAAAWISTADPGSVSFQTHPPMIPTWTIVRFFDGETNSQVKIASLCVSEY
jgi:hypothetical protein